MSANAPDQVIKLMMERQIQVSGAKALVLGLAFKENCPDLRNSRVIDIVMELKKYNVDVDVDVHDPWVSTGAAEKEYGIQLVENPQKGVYDSVIIAVAHDQFREYGADGLRDLCNSGGILYDVKYLPPASAVDGRL